VARKCDIKLATRLPPTKNVRDTATLPVSDNATDCNDERSETETETPVRMLNKAHRCDINEGDVKAKAEAETETGAKDEAEHEAEAL